MSIRRTLYAWFGDGNSVRYCFRAPPRVRTCERDDKTWLSDKRVGVWDPDRFVAEASGSYPLAAPGTPFYLNLLPIAAYVMNPLRDSLKIQKLPYKEQAVIAGAGVWGSIFYPLVVMAVCKTANGDYLFALWCLVGASTLLALKEYFCRFAVIPIGLCFLILLARSLASYYGSGSGGYLSGAASVYHHQLNLTQGVMVGLHSVSVSGTPQYITAISS